MKIAATAILFTLLLFGIIVSSFAQNSISETSEDENTIVFKGRVLDEESKKPVAYVNIGILNKPVGTVSDAEGNFSLTIPQELTSETIQLSLVGYETQKIPVRDIFTINKKNNDIYLTKANVLLDEVVITGKKIREKILGRQADGGSVQATFNPSTNEVTAKLGTEIGVKIASNKFPALLKDFNWYLSANNFDSIKFRINIYSLKNNLPDSLLLNQEIYTQVGNFKNGWNKIDLEPYNITVNTDFVIALQWVDHKFTAKENPKIWIPGTLSAGHLAYFRDASQDSWKKFNANISYNVTILN